jgi:hypothetical protein
MMKVILEKENTAIGIARHVAENEVMHVDKEMIECLYGNGRIPVREEDFDSEWHEFNSFKEAKAYAPSIHEKEFDNGFYKSSFTGPAIRLPYEEVMRAKAGKQTANMPAGTAKLGQPVNRLYVGYKDTSDPSTAVYVVHRLTRKNLPKF